MPQCGVEIEQCRDGIELFNLGEFFEAHEALEDVWRAAPQQAVVWGWIGTNPAALTRAPGVKRESVRRCDRRRRSR